MLTTGKQLRKVSVKVTWWQRQEVNLMLWCLRNASSSDRLSSLVTLFGSKRELFIRSQLTFKLRRSLRTTCLSHLKTVDFVVGRNICGHKLSQDLTVYSQYQLYSASISYVIWRFFVTFLRAQWHLENLTDRALNIDRSASVLINARFCGVLLKIYIYLSTQWSGLKKYRCPYCKSINRY